MSSRAMRLTPTFFHLLLCLSEGRKHGYGMMLEIEHRTDGALRLGPSSLYYSLARLEEAGLIEETAAPRGGEDTHEERRRYYALTRSGRLRLKEEVLMLQDVMSHARARGILPAG